MPRYQNRQKGKTLKRRLIYFVLALICFAACVLIVGFFSHNQLIRGFVGDVIIISLIFFFIEFFFDFHPGRLAIFVLVLAFTTEFLQYLRLISLLGLEQSGLARLVIGSVFDPMDLIAYTIGAIIIYFIDTRLIRRLF